MGRLEYLRNDKFSRFYKAVDKVAKAEGRKTLPMFIDYLYSAVTRGTGITDYVNYKLYNKSRKEREEFVTVIDNDRFYNLLSPAKYKDFFVIKPNFLRNFARYITRDWMVYEDGYDRFEDFVSRHELFMRKPINGLGGHDVEKIRSSEITDHRKFYEDLKTDGAFLEEYVVQHHIISEIAPNSVNTIRVMTYANNDESFIFFAAMRIGVKADVDNFHQGGVGCKVDIKTGKITGNAIDKDGNVYKNHPVSGFQFDGFQIPNWDEVVRITTEAALVNQNIHVVGWDVAVTEEGATFIEGNRRPGWDLVQGVSGGSKQLMNSVLARYREDEEKKRKIKE